MKPTALISPPRQSLLVLVLALAVAVPAGAAPANAAAQPARPLAASPSQPATAGCQWTYYPISGGHLQPPQLLYNDPDNTPIANLSTGNMFKGKAAHLASTGSIDFDGDNKTDVFRTVPRDDGNLQWEYSSGGAGAWLTETLAYAGANLPTSALQFGDFNNDQITDVFGNQYYSSNYHWDYSPSGTGSFTNLNTTGYYADRLALGDFNGDGVTDVFTATLQGAFEQWGYYSGGTGAPINLAYAGDNPALLRFGDFDGDGTTDVFAASQLPDGSTQWKYSAGGAASYVDLITTTVPYNQLQFGDFDGDGKTDVLAALPQPDGGLQVVYWPGGLGAGVSLGHIAAPAPALRVGDFNGDGISDLLALRCGMGAPLHFGPLQTLANSGYATFYRALAGDLRGDGQSDLILVSTCQNLNQFGICASHHLQLGAALGGAGHSFSPVAPQELSAGDFTYGKAFAGDFTGDGKTDVAMVIADLGSLTVTVASSNGDGHFTLGTPQAFTGEADWGSYNAIVGDFNGDGKDDLALTSVCNRVALEAGSCTNGETNRVYVATSNGAGGFTLGPRQDFGLPAGLPPTGWGSFYAFAGDFNGDGKTDLVFNATCQKTNDGDVTCTAGTANLVYTALASGGGNFTLSPVQTYGGSGWGDYAVSTNLVGDVNGDGRSDLVWDSARQAAGPTHNNLVVAGLANPDGTFQLGATQNYGSAWTGYPSLADLNHDGRADLVWNSPPLNNSDVDTYVAATSNGDGTFNPLAPGAVYTSLGYFSMPDNDAPGKVPTSLVLLSTSQNAISNALYVVSGALPVRLYLPLLHH